jgi:hypothetical protein
MLEMRCAAPRQLFSVVLEDGLVLSEGAERIFAAAFARRWNRLIDPHEPRAYIQPLLWSIRKPREEFDAQHVVQP